ncbi:MAG: alpha/beta hydrolase [Caldilineaceae bacterium]
MDRATAVTCANDASSEAIPIGGAVVPTLLIASRQDLVMPVSNVEYTVQTIPNCRVRWIEECGHLPMVEKSQEFLEILTEFLTFDSCNAAEITVK